MSPARARSSAHVPLDPEREVRWEATGNYTSPDTRDHHGSLGAAQRGRDANPMNKILKLVMSGGLVAVVLAVANAADTTAAAGASMSVPMVPDAPSTYT